MSGSTARQWSNRTWWWIRFVAGFLTAMLVEATWHVYERYGWLLGMLIAFGSGLVAITVLMLGRDSYRRAAEEDQHDGGS
jgi:hypothetical protein